MIETMRNWLMTALGVVIFASALAINLTHLVNFEWNVRPNEDPLVEQPIQQSRLLVSGYEIYSALYTISHDDVEIEVDGTVFRNDSDVMKYGHLIRLTSQYEERERVINGQVERLIYVER